MQFHPTAVDGRAGPGGIPGHRGDPRRGRHAARRSGERFVDELAPRDEVSRAIQAKLQSSGERSVSLDMRSIDPARFPNVVSALRDSGLDPSRELVPVAPAAHYMMGGIVTDLHARSTIPGLYAVGEASCTGLHGANRLASNSLSECFVFARRAVADALSAPAPPSASVDEREIRELRALPAPMRADQATRDGPVGGRRHRALAARGCGACSPRATPSARLIGRCALERTESRGAHIRIDYPELDSSFDHRHVVVTGEESTCWQRWD